ncbi:MAG: hypothetical protein ALECFALPRED_001402 [Alectoria fallacina]|uniref:Uncharacterized protein n=1 Tax=Alectoria fallacina TaxID=1903189 RepID=A0A8H3IIH0_9LECA|nr:MAG: hypothetical protein ALECFALPRED_001402 [Alectoria fallacina]
MAITATYTAETVVYIVNKKNNSTRTTTISNTEIDFGKIATPTNLNSDGTVTASVVDNDGSTRIVAYPTTVYSDYAPNITWTGTLSTTNSGTPTCSIAPTGAVAVFPSHPLLPEAVQATGVNTIEDPRGWTFLPIGAETCGDTGNMIENLFPGLGVWNCKSQGDCVGPIGALQTALYLTKTSTSTEPDDGPTSTTPLPEAAPTETTPVVPQPGKGLPAPIALSAAPELAPTTTTTPAANPVSSSSIYEAPEVQLPASNMVPVDSNPPAPASKSTIITPSPAPATVLPTTPVAIPVPVTSTDSKGSITISTSTAIAHPIIVSSTNAQGSIVTSTSLSTAPISVSIPTIVTSTNAQGTVLSSTASLPAIILTTTNAAGSKVLTTSALSHFIPPASAPAPIIINSETITPNAQSQYIVSGQTLAPGSSITLGSGTSTTVLALQTSSGSTAVVFGPSTSLVPSAAGTEPVALTIGSQTITPNAESQYLVSGSTLAAGSTITLGSGSSTTVLALQTSGSQIALVYAPSTSVLTPTPAAATPPAITIGSETITANSQTQYVIGSQTLTAGGVVTVSGTEVSLAPGESDVVVGSSTEALAPYITAGFGSGVNGTGPQIFAGSAEARWGRKSGWRAVGLTWMAAVGVAVWL